MLKRALVLTMVLTLGGAAAAQNPRFTIFGGYSYGNTDYAPGPRSDLHGYEVTFESFRIKPWMTVVFDGSSQAGWNQFPISCVTFPVCTPAIPNVRAREYNFLAGPQVSTFRGNFRPFLRVLGGASRVSVATSGFFQSSIAWTVGGGGGVDYRWRGPFSWRVQADYLRTNVFGLHQNMLRASTGIVVQF